MTVSSACKSLPYHSEWQYKGEGNANIVFAYRGTKSNLVGHVLRVRKKRPSQVGHDVAAELEKEVWSSVLGTSEGGLPREVHYIATQLGPLLGSSYVNGGVLVPLPSEIMRLCQNRGVEVDPTSPALLMTDHTLAVPTSEGSGQWMPIGPAVCVEIKPKAGFITDSPWVAPENRLKRQLPRFSLHQVYKFVKGKVPCLSTYNPLDLFSGEEGRMRRALQALMVEPQNNLRVFIDGQQIYGGQHVHGKKGLEDQQHGGTPSSMLKHMTSLEAPGLLSRRLSIGQDAGSPGSIEKWSTDALHHSGDHEGPTVQYRHKRLRGLQCSSATSATDLVISAEDQNEDLKGTDGRGAPTSRGEDKVLKFMSISTGHVYQQGGILGEVPSGFGEDHVVLPADCCNGFLLDQGGAGWQQGRTWRKEGLGQVNPAPGGDTLQQLDGPSPSCTPRSQESWGSLVVDQRACAGDNSEYSDQSMFDSDMAKSNLVLSSLRPCTVHNQKLNSIQSRFGPLLENFCVDLDVDKCELLISLLQQILTTTGVLDRLLIAQRLDRLDIEGVYPMYQHIIEQRRSSKPAADENEVGKRLEPAAPIDQFLASTLGAQAAPGHEAVTSEGTKVHAYGSDWEGVGWGSYNEAMLDSGFMKSSSRCSQLPPGAVEPPRLGLGGWSRQSSFNKEQSWSSDSTPSEGPSAIGAELCTPEVARCDSSPEAIATCRGEVPLCNQDVCWQPLASNTLDALLAQTDEKKFSILRQYLTAATAKDCGIMITVQEVRALSGTPGPLPEGCQLLRDDGTGRLFFYKLAFVDLDMKPLQKICAHYDLDKRIMACAQANMDLVKQLGGW